MADWHAQAREMSARGMSIRQIAAEVGKSHGGVQYALQPEKDGKRPCPECGRPKSRKHRLCRSCYRAPLDERRAEAEQMWAAGATVHEMAAFLGVKDFPSTVYRDSGWDLPYRYKNTKRQLRAA